jgi:hypothetical protein
LRWIAEPADPLETAAFLACEKGAAASSRRQNADISMGAIYLNF